MLKPNDTVVHPQWGRGTVLFDKPHCIGIRFLEYGHVNFSQEEWALQHSPGWRFHTCTEDLEYVLEQAVDDGELSEGEATELLARKAHILEVRRRKALGVEDAYAQYSSGKLSEDDFYMALKRFAQAFVYRNSHEDVTFLNLHVEDAITESLMDVWLHLKDFDPNRTSFKTYLTIIVRNNIQDLLRKHKTSRGHLRHVELDENIVGASKELSAEKRLLFEEWMANLDSTDRSIAKMLQDGLTQEQIGQALGMTHQAVSKRLLKLGSEGQRPF